MEVNHYRQILHQCFPDLTVTSIEFMDGGTFRACAVGAGPASERNFVFRLPHGGAGGDLLLRERRACDLLGPLLPPAIPRYVFFSEGCAVFRQPVAGNRKLEGVPLQDCALGEPALRQVASVQQDLPP